MDPRLTKWNRWLDAAEVEITRLVVARDIFWSVQKLIRDNPDIQKPSSFYRYLGDTYVSHIVIGIRRQVKIDNQSISIARLLSEISGDAKRMTRTYHRSLYGNVPELADPTFDKFCDREGDDHISAAFVTRDLEALKRAARICEKFGDKRIAHSDKKGPATLPRHSDINASVETLDKLFTKYLLLFRACDMRTVMPVYQYDWQQVFDVAWRRAER